MLPAVAIGVASFIGRRVAIAIGVKALQNAFIAGGARALLKAIAVRLAVWFFSGWLISTLWGFIVSTTIFIYNFDWNASDQELDDQINAALDSLASIAGSATGLTLGWVTCGAIAGTVVTKINPVAAAQIIEKLGEEAAEEIIAAWTALARAGLNIAFRSFLTWGYKNLRRFLLKPALGAFSRAVFGEDKFAKWGASDGPRVTLAETVENVFESVTPKFLQNFLESAWEEFWDSCAEVGYLTASLLDNYGQQQASNVRQTVIGAERTVEIVPNREAPNQRIILSGNERALMPAIVQTLATHQLIGQQDLGTLVGYPAEESYIKSPDDLTLIIEFRSVSAPPLNRPGEPAAQRVTLKIPGVKRTALDWTQIKTAAGGSNGYLYGPKKVTFRISNGGNTTVYASTHEEAEQRGRALLALSTNEIIGESPGEEKEAGRRSRVNNNVKKIIQIYPYEATVIYAKKTTDTTKGRVRLSDGQRVTYENYKFLLWPDVPPVNFSQEIANLFVGES